MKKSNNVCPESNISPDFYKQCLATAASVYRDQDKKTDGGKPMMELIPTSVYRSLGKVLTHGAEKYGPNTWQNVEVERYVGALLRHLCAFLDDPNGVDADSGLAHTEHLLANAAFINDAVINRRVEDNAK